MRIRTHLICISILFVAVLAMFGDILFSAEHEIISRFQTDLSRQFVQWRHFGFSQLRQGNLPLWNPYIFSGTPYLAGFQSGLLYPPNWLYLILPLRNAINIGIIFHMLLGGTFMYCWAGYRGISVWGRLLSGLLFMFCGSHYMHVYAGHLPNLCTLVWAPLLFLSIDGLSDHGKARWVMLGICSVSMQILAGHPQYVYYTAIGATIYVVLHLISRFQKMKKNGIFSVNDLLIRFGGFLAILFCAALITAIQLFPGLSAATESVRGEGLNYDFASMFSFPPENFLTLIAPNIFGDTMSMPYWGRCNLWEMVIFVSLGGLLLAVCGALWGNKSSRRLCFVMCIICTILALGVYTPLFDLLFHLMPGFDRFRGTSKFMFLTSMFLILLSGAGFDWLIMKARSLGNANAKDRAKIKKQRIPIVIVAVVTLGVSIVLFAGATFVRVSSSVKDEPSNWHVFMKTFSEKSEIYIKKEAYDYPPFIAKAGLTAWHSLLFAACTSLTLSLVLFAVPFLPRISYLVGVIAVIEIFLFAHHFKASFDLNDVLPPPQLEKFFSQHTGDYRLFWPGGDPNQGMLSGVPGIWGYDPGVLLRYAQFMKFTQKGNPDKATQHITFRNYNRLYSMLRCRYLITKSKLKKSNLPPAWKGEGINVYELPKHLPRVLLVEQFLVRPDRDQIFSEMTHSRFDPEKTVILEKIPIPTPQPSPDGSKPGKLKITESSTDCLIVNAELSRPAIMVITDAYSSGWRVISEQGSSQKEYRILPANYILRAIPLEVGKHMLTIEYSPFSFRIGVWISLISMLVYFLVLVLGYIYKIKANSVKGYSV